MISGNAAKKEGFIEEMEKSAAIMTEYNAEFALASIFLFIPLNVFEQFLQYCMRHTGSHCMCIMQCLSV